MKALLDRGGVVSFANGLLVKTRWGTLRSLYDVPVPVVRQIQCFTSSSQTTGSSPICPLSGIGRDIGDVKQDDEDIARAKTLGQTMAQLLNHLNLHPLPAQKPVRVDHLMTKKKK
jgi:hypothetical protein